jgi:hypothetical protein
VPEEEVNQSGDSLINAKVIFGTLPFVALCVVQCLKTKTHILETLSASPRNKGGGKLTHLSLTDINMPSLPVREWC